MWYFVAIMAIISCIQIFMILDVMFHITNKISKKLEKARKKRKIKRKEKRYNKKEDCIPIEILEKEFAKEVHVVESILKEEQFKNFYASRLYLPKAYDYFLAFREIREIDENSLERLFCLYKAMEKKPIIDDALKNQILMDDYFLPYFKEHFAEMTYKGVPIIEKTPLLRYKDFAKELNKDIDSCKQKKVKSVLIELQNKLKLYFDY